LLAGQASELERLQLQSRAREPSGRRLLAEIGDGRGGRAVDVEENTCTMPVLQVLRVFCDSEGQFGSPLGVVLDGLAISLERRRALAAELGFSETVYLDDPNTGQLRIFTPAAEMPFAGHPLVGVAWLLSRHLGGPVTELNPPAGAVPTWTSDDQVWIRAPLADAPPWRLNHVADAAAATP
jgi:predicted PhzF superfamily epimerase YddE/YHI9